MAKFPFFWGCLVFWFHRLWQKAAWPTRTRSGTRSASCARAARPRWLGNRSPHRGRVRTASSASAVSTPRSVPAATRPSQVSLGQGGGANVLMPLVLKSLRDPFWRPVRLDCRLWVSKQVSADSSFFLNFTAWRPDVGWLAPSLCLVSRLWCTKTCSSNLPVGRQEHSPYPCLSVGVAGFYLHFWSPTDPGGKEMSDCFMDKCCT